MSFLAFALWALGGTIVVAICAVILAAVAIEVRKKWLVVEQVYNEQKPATCRCGRRCE